MRSVVQAASVPWARDRFIEILVAVRNEEGEGGGGTLAVQARDVPPRLVPSHPRGKAAPPEAPPHLRMRT